MKTTLENSLDIQETPTVFLEEFGITVNSQNHKFFLDALDLAKPLLDIPNTQFTVISDDTIRVTVEAVTIDLQTYWEIFIVHEIFFDGAYNILATKEIVVWDIGMNVGIASLYFASKENVLAVFGYEPFEGTYKRAKQNFDLNPGLAKKIKHYPYGISHANANLTVDYCYEWHGASTVNGVPEMLNGRDDIVSQTINLVSANDTLDIIMGEYPGIDIVAKIDCEGSEYEIIESLYTSKKLRHFKAVLLEWHDPQKNNSLKQWFKESGFSVIFFNPYHPYGIAMAYAFRTE
ncbi:FkbM family methyltransferase [Nostoc sp. NIES-4103]|nr:FkbM family methyltransferase [Nostoc sp. NIES-4103]